jgi:hypothetical protein
MIDFFEEINGLKYLHLSNIEEPACNSVILTIFGMSENALGKKGYLFKFEHYTSYCVIDEIYNNIVENDYEEWVGQLFCMYSKSYYLDYIRKDTRTESYHDFERSLRHYAFYCLNHTIHITSFDIPLIEKVYLK